MASFFTPDLSTEAEARRTLRHAAVAVLISAALTTAVVVYVVTSGTEIAGAYISAWTLFDVVLMLGLAIAVYKGSRVGAVLLVVYWAFNLIFRIATGMGVGLMPLFGIFYVNGLRASWALHGIRRDADLDSQLRELESVRAPSMDSDVHP